MFLFKGEEKYIYMKSGDNGEEDPPVPISNTEVKLFSAEDTWRETARENRTLPVLRKNGIAFAVPFFYCTENF